MKFIYYYRETNPKLGQYLGLVAVLDVLRDIHNVPINIVNKSATQLKSIAVDNYTLTV